MASVLQLLASGCGCSVRRRNMLCLLLLTTQLAAALNEKEIDRVSEKWDKAAPPSTGAWYTHKLVVKTFSERLAAGSPNWVEHLKERYGARRKCLSIGCGDGGVERDMVRAGFCNQMLGIDLSPVRVGKANANVPLHLRERLEFKVANGETELHGKNFDMVLFSHSLHHIDDLESMARAVQRRIMSDDGVLVLQEYVGPVRWQFSEQQLYLMHSILLHMTQKYPDRAGMLRKCAVLWDGKRFKPPDADAVKADDPSETVRSNMIVPVLLNHFNLIENVQLGGNFFQWLLYGCYSALEDEAGNAIVKEMLEYEMFLVDEGILTSDYVFQVWNKTGTLARRNIKGGGRRWPN